MNIVNYAANKFGYVVHALKSGKTIQFYQAGNHKLESATYVDPGSFYALSEDELLIMAKNTANEIAEEIFGKTNYKIQYEDALETLIV
jgi:hypothetical protein